MLKIIGFFCILLCTGGLGFSFCEDYKKRLSSLYSLHNMIEYIVGRISIQRDTLPEAFLQSASRMESPYREFLLTLYEKIAKNEGDELKDIWKESLFRLKEELKEEDFNQLNSVMDQTGFLNSDQQKDALEIYLNTLRKQIEEMEKNEKEKCKIYKTVGIMTGILVMVIFW